MILAYPIEIWPYTLQARGLKVAIATTEIGLIMGQFFNPLTLKTIGWKYYIISCTILATFLVLMRFLFPETKGHTLEQIAEIFKNKVSDENLAEKKTNMTAGEEGQIEYK